MKNKTKIMLGLAALTAGTLAAGATGTFAWFTTNKTATATYSNISAVSTTGKLNVQITGVSDSAVTATGYSEAASATGTSASKTSDVSSADGLKFYHPDWVGEAANANAVNKVDDITGKAGYYTQYKVDIKNAAASGSEKIKPVLDGVKITSTGNNMAGWSRVAVIYGDVTTDATTKLVTSGTVAGVFQTTISDSNKMYTRSIKGSNDEGYSADKKTIKLEKVGDTLHAVTAEGTTGLNISLGNTELEPSSDSSILTIYVSVWLEGTMADSQQEVITQKEELSVALTFASSNV